MLIYLDAKYTADAQDRITQKYQIPDLKSVYRMPHTQDTQNTLLVSQLFLIISA